MSPCGVTITKGRGRVAKFLLSTGDVTLRQPLVVQRQAGGSPQGEKEEEVEEEGGDRLNLAKSINVVVADRAGHLGLFKTFYNDAIIIFIRCYFCVCFQVNF